MKLEVTLSILLSFLWTALSTALRTDNPFTDVTEDVFGDVTNVTILAFLYYNEDKRNDILLMANQFQNQGYLLCNLVSYFLVSHRVRG